MIQTDAVQHAYLSFECVQTGMNPDFSGDYALNCQASTLTPGGADGIESGSMHIEHREPNFHCHLKYVFADGNEFERDFELITDGRETQVTDDGHTSTISLRWDANALVLTGRNEASVILRFELLDAGRCLRVTEQNRGLGRDQDNIFVFERQ